jgi:hypothetical protein
LGDFGNSGPQINILEALEFGPGPAGSSKGTGNILTLELNRVALSARAAELPVMIAQPLGAAFESARWRFDHAYWDGALPILERVAKEGKRPLRDEAATLARRARLERALAWRDEQAAAREFEALASGPKDFTAAAARIARAALAWRQGKQDEARRWMNQGLDAWRKDQQKALAPKKGSLEEDLLKIHSALLDPNSSERVAGSLSPPPPKVEFPYTPGPHVHRVVPSHATVTLASGRTEEIALPNQELEAFVVTLLKRFGSKLEPFTEWPNPNNLDATGIDAFMRELHPRLPSAPPWRLFLPPVISSVKFTDDLRSHAEVSVRFGSAGQTLVLVKSRGAWDVMRTTQWWIE